MKILIYGAGVTGCTYGWLLSEAGHHITVMVRKGQKQHLYENGIHLTCTDFRQGKKITTDTIFRPDVIEELDAGNDFEYIIVATNAIQLHDVLPVLGKYAGKAHVLFFQNNWNCFDEIGYYLKPEQYFFGFPFMTGGRKAANRILSVISGMKYSHTPIGEADGKVSPRVNKIAEAMEKAGLKPVISRHILRWIITHYATAAGLCAGILSTGSAADFVNDCSIIRMTIGAIREGFAICLKRGYDPKAGKANKLYRLPLFIGVPLARKIYNNESLQLMFNRHIKHAETEIRLMIDDIIKSGKYYEIPTPCMETLKNIILQRTTG